MVSGATTLTHTYSKNIIRSFQGKVGLVLIGYFVLLLRILTKPFFLIFEKNIVIPRSYHNRWKCHFDVCWLSNCLGRSRSYKSSITALNQAYCVWQARWKVNIIIIRPTPLKTHLKDSRPNFKIYKLKKCLKYPYWLKSPFYNNRY